MNKTQHAALRFNHVQKHKCFSIAPGALIFCFNRDTCSLKEKNEF